MVIVLSWDAFFRWLGYLTCTVLCGGFIFYVVAFYFAFAWPSDWVIKRRDARYRKEMERQERESQVKEGK